MWDVLIRPNALQSERHHCLANLTTIPSFAMPSPEDPKPEVEAHAPKEEGARSVKKKRKMYCIKCGLETVPGKKIRSTAPAVVVSIVSLSIAFYTKGKDLFDGHGELVLVGLLIFGVIASIVSDVMQLRVCRSCGSEDLVATTSPRAHAERAKLKVEESESQVKTKDTA